MMANAQLKAGRFTVNQGVGNEQVDGVSARTDLRGGFTVSAFAGAPVVYGNYGDRSRSDLASQRNFMFGGRLAWHAAKVGEIGVDYLQDGTAPNTQAAPTPGTVNFTRKLVGVDMKLTPCAFIDLSGRTVLDLAPSMIAPQPGVDVSRVAEDDYNLNLKLAKTLTLGGSYIERNLFAYFAGSTLPTLFNQNEQGAFKATGAKVTWVPVADLQIVGDLRRTDRDSAGITTAVRHGRRSHTDKSPRASALAMNGAAITTMVW